MVQSNLEHVCCQHINLDAWGISWVKTFSPASLRSSGHSAMPCYNWNHCGGILSGCSRLEHIWNYQKTVTGTIITRPSHSLPVLLGLSAKTWAIAELFILAWDYIHSWVINSSGVVGGWILLCHTGFCRMLFIVLLKITKLVFPRQQPASSQAMPTKKDIDVSCRTVFKDKCMYRGTPREVFDNSKVSSH